MRKSFKFKLFRNRRKSNKLRSELYVFSQIYNHSLSLINRHYRIFGKNPKKSVLQKHLKRLMDRGLRRSWKNLGYSQGIQEVTDRIYKSYDGFYSWCKKRSGLKKSPPKFKPFRKYKSFTLKQAGWKLDEERGIVHIGKEKYRYNKSRKFEGVIKTVTIKRDSVGDWYIILSCDLGDDFKPKKVVPVTGKSAGFDFGLKCFLISSEGDEIESPQYLKKSLVSLRKKSRNFSRKKRGSKNRRKAGRTLGRLHRKIANQRLDFHFKLALSLVRKYDNLFFEDLDLTKMKLFWGRKVSDLGLYQLIKILQFKALEYMKIFHQVDRYYPSTKKCSCCGDVKEEMSLKERVFKCRCGHEMDRDLNASINILCEGASSLGLDNVRHSFCCAVVA